MNERTGEFLVRIGVLKPHQVEDVLRAQRAGDARISGDIPIELGYINDEVLRGYGETKAS